MRDAKVHEMIADACLSASDEELRGDLRAFLEKRGVHPDDRDALLQGPARLPVYRKLIRNNLLDVVNKMMPRARARLGEAFDAAFARFLEEVGPRTHYLRDVPAEFLAWVTPQWRGNYVADLAAHELVEFLVGIAPRAKRTPEVTDVAIDRGVVFTENMRLMRYAYAVHELSSDVEDRSAPEARDVCLLVYRDAEHRTRFLELTPLARAILERLAQGKALGASISEACATENEAMSDAVLADTARLLADLGDRGVLLGGKP